nr:DUF1800 domain-containing protein [Rhodoferax sp.]
MNKTSTNFPSRRAAIQTIATSAYLGSGLAFSQAFAQPATAPSSPSNISVLSLNGQAWRAMSRVGYGPSAALVQAIQAARSPRDWALQQVDAAFVASQQAPHIAAELADFNAPLPRIYEGFQRERELRTKDKTKTPKAEDSAPAKRMDFADPRDPAHFSRMLVQQAAAWRLSSCSQPELENPLLARMTEFWFNHLNVFSGKGAVRPFAGHYVINVARHHALGKFEDLLLASARHPAMLLYLDQAQSVADGTQGQQGKTRGLNENYARELMELHTLGVDGGYSQADVRALARVLTGWTVSRDDAEGFRFAPRLHDRGYKQVLGQRFPTSAARGGMLEGEDAIRMLARHPATAKRVSLRLAQFFVTDQPSNELVQRISRSFTATQGDLRAVMRTVLESPEFWAPENRLFKTPMDYACSALAATQAATQEQIGGEPYRRNIVLTLGFLANAGQPLHGWQTPDGYKVDAATWLVPEALTRRADFALALARKSSDLEFLTPYLGAATREAVAKESAALRPGLMLASPDFMYK